MIGLAVCCPELRRAIMRHSMQVDSAFGHVMDENGTVLEACPFCKKGFEWKGI